MELKYIRHNITFYRSLLREDDSVWCESQDLEEVLKQSAGKDCTFEKMVQYIGTNDWEEWIPEVEIR